MSADPVYGWLSNRNGVPIFGACGTVVAVMPFDVYEAELSPTKLVATTVKV
jgi:hypothetical protein